MYVMGREIPEPIASLLSLHTCDSSVLFPLYTFLMHNVRVARVKSDYWKGAKSAISFLDDDVVGKCERMKMSTSEEKVDFH